MRSNVLQPAAVAVAAAACIAVPACVPAALVAQGPAPTVPAMAPRTVEVPLALRAGVSDLLGTLGLPLEAALWIATANPGGLTNAKYLAQASIPPPPLPAGLTADQAATYTSLYTVINAAIKIVSAPASDLTTGQFDKIAADLQKAITGFTTAAGDFPGDAVATIAYVLSQFGGTNVSQLGVVDTATTLESSDTVSTLAGPDSASSAADPLATLGLPVEVALWIGTANPGGLTNAKYLAQASIPPPPLPAGLTADEAATYTSLYTVINAAIKIVSAPASDLTTGQFGKIGADLQKAITGFTTSASDFPGDALATLNYAAGQLGGGSGFAAQGISTETVGSQSLAEGAVNDTVDAGAKSKTVTKTPDLSLLPKGTAAELPKSKPALPKPGKFVNQLQDAVDNALGANALKVGKKSDDSTKSDSTPFSGLKLKTPTPDSFGIHKPEKKTDEKPSEKSDAAN